MVWDSLAYLIPLSLKWEPLFSSTVSAKRTRCCCRWDPLHVGHRGHGGRSTSCGWWRGGSSGARWRRRNGATTVVAQARCGVALMRLRRAPLSDTGPEFGASRRPRHPGKPRKQIVSTMLARDHVIARTEVPRVGGSVVRQPRRLCRCRRSWPDAVDLLHEGADYLRDFRPGASCVPQPTGGPDSGCVVRYPPQRPSKCR